MRGEDASEPRDERVPGLVERVRAAAAGEPLPPPPAPAEPEPEPDPPPAARPRGSDRRTLVLAGVSTLLVLALAGALALALTNVRRADRWENRAEQVALRAEILNDLLVERSHDLNRQTRLLNATAGKLRAARRALDRSESDVGRLSRRQRELANEKAQIEDAREQLTAAKRALERVTTAMFGCNARLVGLVEAVASEDWGWFDAYGDAIVSDCNAAGAALGAYLALYG